ncbi:Hypothetical_protein [Hexamita inflata]|uniref:Hypothetical_protein n=1 Tax=Hexamita inflata TaxID=28002 RepID=A0AA86U537_9EUKA|nr:Hypothetical protein HINF_LOCUS25907 [Hexamita inflata]
MVLKSTQVQLYLQQSIFAYLQNLVEIKYQQALHDMEIQLILYYNTKSILQQVKVDIFSPTLINIWSEKLQIKIKSVYVKAQKSQLQLGSLQECLLKNRGAHTVPYLVNPLHGQHRFNKHFPSVDPSLSCCMSIYQCGRTCLHSTTLYHQRLLNTRK